MIKKVVNFWEVEKCTLRENPGYAYVFSPNVVNDLILLLTVQR